MEILGVQPGRNGCSVSAVALFNLRGHVVQSHAEYAIGVSASSPMLFCANFDFFLLYLHTLDFYSHRVRIFTINSKVDSVPCELIPPII